ncbi:MAG: Abi family protein [Bacteroidaceae bacterium]|nr:Abi family protein [Bacteroidaceae bacterium]
MQRSCSPLLLSIRCGLQVAPLESWLTIVTLIRNSCCHYTRVWNTQNTIRLMLPNRMAGSWKSEPQWR